MIDVDYGEQATNSITKDFNEWMLSARSIEAGEHLIHDFEGAKRISRHFESYMLCPHARVGGQHVSAKSALAETFGELVNQLACRTEQLYLYSLEYHYGVPTYGRVIEQSFEHQVLEYPDVRKGFWKVRYGAL